MNPSAVMNSIYMGKFIHFNVPKKPVGPFCEIVGMSEVISERLSTLALRQFIYLELNNVESPWHHRTHIN